ncbi:MAG: hypothetical protein KDB48_10140 [Solirubrobacterales bacterium]|nr:hypothetical protein [Solirubrobacterales bacterium]
MDRFLTATGLVLTLVVGVLSLPGPALAGGNGQVAKAECRNDRRTDKADFVRDYGRGKASMLRCVRSELRKARRECRSRNVSAQVISQPNMAKAREPWSAAFETS